MGISSAVVVGRVWCSALNIGLDWIAFTKRVACAGSSCHGLDGMAPELRLRIIIEQPPPGIDFGLQKGNGDAYETVQTQRSGGKDLVLNSSHL